MKTESTTTPPAAVTPSEPMPKKPAITGPLSQAWDYMVNRNGVCRVHEFDDDFSPIGPSLRQQLEAHGLRSSTSGKTTIIFLT